MKQDPDTPSPSGYSSMLRLRPEASQWPTFGPPVADRWPACGRPSASAHNFGAIYHARAPRALRVHDFVAIWSRPLNDSNFFVDFCHFLYLLEFYHTWMSTFQNLPIQKKIFGAQTFQMCKSFRGQVPEVPKNKEVELWGQPKKPKGFYWFLWSTARQNWR